MKIQCCTQIIFYVSSLDEVEAVERSVFGAVPNKKRKRPEEESAFTNPYGGTVRGSKYFLHWEFGFYYWRWVRSDNQLRSVEPEIHKRNSGRDKAIVFSQKDEVPVQGDRRRKLAFPVRRVWFAVSARVKDPNHGLQIPRMS
ncbi:unnamed protein product [Cuscuta campestris]|uniref:Uncharacterized protein n=1 Tax=Cuscuta campestris TaxID=132261 RepID=A0A484MJN8_9ASTE|nr:unnamed protein product [Cuscuta campestris]